MVLTNLDIANDADITSESSKLLQELETLANDSKTNIQAVDFARFMDKSDPLAPFHAKFYYPTLMDILGSDIDKIQKERVDQELSEDLSAIYFNGNSLGLPSKLSIERLKMEIDKWATWGSLGYFRSKTDSDLPWTTSEEYLREGGAYLIGAKPEEVTFMNAVTVNIHLLFVSFYRPTTDRYMVMLEDKAFASDHYAIESHIRTRNLDPAKCMLLVKPKEGKHCLSTEDILEAIETHGEKIAVIFFSSVHYYTGQLLNVPVITKAGKSKGCYVGWNLTHGIGNVKMHTHDWDVDFGTWTSYKYLNGGPGCISGIYIHEKYKNNDFPKYLGWWGNKFSTRMHLSTEFDPDPSPSVYKISNSPAFYVTILKSSLEIFQEAGIENLARKSRLLTGYLYYLLTSMIEYGKTFEIITSPNSSERGNQLSIFIKVPDKTQHFHDVLEGYGVICDVRDPGVIRVAPAPLYNTFRHVYRFCKVFQETLKNI